MLERLEEKAQLQWLFTFAQQQQQQQLGCDLYRFLSTSSSSSASIRSFQMQPNPTIRVELFARSQLRNVIWPSGNRRSSRFCQRCCFRVIPIKKSCALWWAQVHPNSCRVPDSSCLGPTCSCKSASQTGWLAPLRMVAVVASQLDIERAQTMLGTRANSSGTRRWLSKNIFWFEFIRERKMEIARRTNSINKSSTAWTARFAPRIIGKNIHVSW